VTTQTKGDQRLSYFQIAALISINPSTNFRVMVGPAMGFLMGGKYNEEVTTTVSNGSKYGFITAVQGLVRLGFELIDCQVYTEHLESLGAREIPRKAFMKLLAAGMERPWLTGAWTDIAELQQAQDF